MYLGPDHVLTMTFQKNFEAAKIKINRIPSSFRMKQKSMKESI